MNDRERGCDLGLVVTALGWVLSAKHKLRFKSELWHPMALDDMEAGKGIPGVEHHEKKRAGKKRACLPMIFGVAKALALSRSGEEEKQDLGRTPDSGSGYAETKVLEFSLRTTGRPVVTSWICV